MRDDLPTDLLPKTANLRLGLCDGGWLADDDGAADEDMIETLLRKRIQMDVVPS